MHPQSQILDYTARVPGQAAISEFVLHLSAPLCRQTNIFKAQEYLKAFCLTQLKSETPVTKGLVFVAD